MAPPNDVRARTVRRPRPPLAAALALGLTAGTAAATDPGSSGPFAAGVRTLDVPVTGGDVLSTDVHYPDAAGEVDPAAGACPLLVFGHGFASTKDPYAGHGAHWASRGYVTLIPDMAGGADHSKNADDLVALVAWALAENDDPASFLYQHLDPLAIGSTGHSAGGLSSLVAAAREPRIVAVAPFDPVDNGGLGVGAMPSIAAPVAITHSDDGACNADGSSRDLYAAGRPVRRRVHILGATHCDPLDPPNFGCELVCGAATPERQELYRRYVTGWFEYWLRCDPSYHEWVYGARVADDVTAGRIDFESDPDPGPTEPCPLVAPGPGKGLMAVRDGVDVVLTWQPVLAPPVNEYRVYRTDALPFVYGTPHLTAPTPSARDAGALDAGASLLYRVRAANAAGEGP